MTRPTGRNALSVLGITAAILVCGTCVGAAPKARTVEFMLDDVLGKFALYSGDGIRCYVLPKETVSSLEDLQRRIVQLPRGAIVHWMPSQLEPSGAPILFAKGQFARFAKFCRDRGVELIVEGIPAK